MGTREVYEQKLRGGNLHHDPTMNPGLGTPRCPRCLSLLAHDSDKGEWTITPVLHDATAVVPRPSKLQRKIILGHLKEGFGEREDCGQHICGGIGGMLSAIHSFNTGIPYLQNRLRGPKWLPFIVGLPPLLLFSGASAAFGGYALPKFAQLTVTSYYVASSASHYGISLLTRYIEEAYTSRSRKEGVR